MGVLLVDLRAVATGLCFFWWGRASKKVSTETLPVFNNVKLPLGVWVSSMLWRDGERMDFIFFFAFY